MLRLVRLLADSYWNGDIDEASNLQHESPAAIGLLPNTTIKIAPARSSPWEASPLPYRQRLLPLLRRHRPPRNSYRNTYPTPQFAADDFNRADGGLGLNWAKPVPASEQTLVIVNNEVTPDIEDAHCYAYWIGNTFSQDQYSQVRISNVGSWNGVIVRAQSTVDRFYLAFVFGPNDYRIYLRKDGLYYDMATGSTETWVAGDIIRLEAVGLNPVQLTLFRNGNPVLTNTDYRESGWRQPGDRDIFAFWV